MSQRPPSARSASTPTASSSSRPPATPFEHGQKNVWTDVIDANKAAAKERGDAGRPDAVLFVVGSKGCGKTTLVNRLLYPDKTETPKPTEGMEYNYARRTHATNIDRKDVAHVWEIAGSRQFADEVTEQDNVFLGARQVTTAVVCICVDLAKPTEAMRTAEYWLGRIHARCEKTFEKLVGAGKSATGATPQAKRTSLRFQRPRRFTPGHIDPSQRRDCLHRRDEARRDATNGPGAHEGVDARAAVPRARQRRRTLLPRRLRQRFFASSSLDVISRRTRG